MRLPRFRSLLPLLLTLLTLLTGGFIFSQSSPQKTVTNELTKLKLLNSYKTALIAQQNFNAAQAAAQRALAEWNAVSEQAIKDERLAKGTTFQPNIDKEEVVIIPPKTPPVPQTPPSPAKVEGKPQAEEKK